MVPAILPASGVVGTVPFDFRAKLVKPAGVVDDAAAAAYADRLCEAFYASPEGVAFVAKGLSLGWTELLIRGGLATGGATPATLAPAALETVVFERFREDAACAPDSAVSILEELRAFYRFAARAYGLATAAACLAILEQDGIERRLQRALAKRRATAKRTSRRKP